MRYIFYCAIFAQFFFSTCFGNDNHNGSYEVCSPNWIRYNDEKCIKIIDDTLRSFDDAQSACTEQSHDSTLVVIRSSEEQEFLSSFLFKTQRKVDNFWIGAKFSLQNNSYNWIGNVEINYTNWDVDRPKKRSNSCVQLQADDAVLGKWKDSSCRKKNAVLCQRMQFWTHDVLHNAFLVSRKEHRNAIDEASDNIRNLTFYLENAHQRITKQKQNLANAAQQIGEQQESLKNAFQRIEAQNQNQANVTQQIVEQKQSLANAHQKIDEQKQNLASDDQKIDKQKQNLENAQQSINNANQQIDAQKQGLANAHQKIVEQKQNLENAQQSINNANQKIDEQKQGLANAHQKINEQNQNLENAQQRINNANQKIDEQKQGLANAHQKIDEQKQNLENINHRINELKQNFENANQKMDEQKRSLIPIGFIYVQMPNEKSPAEIWPWMTWADVSSAYAGVFFRVDGGGAAGFGHVQEENFPRITDVHNEGPCYHRHGSSTVIGGWSGKVYTGGWKGEGVCIKFLTSGGEARPRNMAIRVWKRTA